ncbi:MAG: transcriptional regulator domain-containing protein [Caulobacteraceae bacterium]
MTLRQTAGGHFPLKDGDETMPKEDWRLPAAYDRAAQLDPAGVAWEFLRRNRDYQAAFDAASKDADLGTEGPAARWGLRFPGGPEPARRRN